MSSLIMSVLGIDAAVLWCADKINLYHSGDEEPFANVLYKNGHACLRVGSGEVYEHAASVNLGRYAKYRLASNILSSPANPRIQSQGRWCL